MRQKTLKTVVTFASTADAMACEACAKQFGIPGRIIPVPSAISAGCGLAWCAEQQDRPALVEALDAHALACEGIHEVELY